MPFVLCHECLTWIEPKRNRCPDCPATIDLSEPDPDPVQLRRRLGDLVCRLGEIRVQRTGVPTRGTLSATTNGLFFLPQRIEPAFSEIDVPTGAASVFSSLGTLLWSPLGLLDPRSRWETDHSPLLSHPEPLELHDSDRLPELLMENPGAFFVACHVIRWCECRRQRGLIQRRQMTTLRFQLLSDSHEFRERFSRVPHTPGWQHIGCRF